MAELSVGTTVAAVVLLQQRQQVLINIIPLLVIVDTEVVTYKDRRGGFLLL